MADCVSKQTFLTFNEAHAHPRPIGHTSALLAQHLILPRASLFPMLIMDCFEM
jgi:hypothetical protein